MTDTKKARRIAAREIDGSKERIVYRCATCNLVLRQELSDAPPLYCPNCAILHLAGEMKRTQTRASDNVKKPNAGRTRNRLTG